MTQGLPEHPFEEIRSGVRRILAQIGAELRDFASQIGMELSHFPAQPRADIGHIAIGGNLIPERIATQEIV
jgi:hypothetical protein